MPRKQCAKCPWKTTTDPDEIPGGYSREKHRALRSTIARPGDISALGGGLHVMACHESHRGAEIACVGWVAHQLGPGNNLALRIAASSGEVETDFELDGDQHESLEATLGEHW